jgi:hypothetical protein
MASLPPSLRPLFWDCRTESIDVESQAPFVLERVLEYGSLAAVRWALATFGDERIKEFLRCRGARTLSRKTLSFWTLLLGIEREKCFERSSLSHSRTFWNY